MNARRPLIVACLAGLAAAGAAWQHLAAIEKELRQNAELVHVLVAARDLPPNEVLDPADVRIATMPRQQVPAGAFDQVESIVAQRVVVAVRTGNPILAAYISESGSALSFFLSGDKRAVTIAVDDVSGLAGLLRPGDSVDVLALFELTAARDAGGRAIARTILQDVTVLATGNVVSPQPPPLNDDESRDKTSTPEVRNVTVVVDAKQAQELILAQHIGTLALVLRSNEDTHHADLATTTERDLTRTVEAPVRRDSPSWIEKRHKLMQ